MISLKISGMCILRKIRYDVHSSFLGEKLWLEVGASNLFFYFLYSSFSIFLIFQKKVIARMEMSNKRLRDVIDYLDSDELLRIKVDLEKGGIHLKDFVSIKLKERENLHRQICSNCQADIDPHSTSIYTLVFGPSDFKKKATFCGMDCLEYFLESIKEMKLKKNIDKFDKSEV